MPDGADAPKYGKNFYNYEPFKKTEFSDDFRKTNVCTRFFYCYVINTINTINTTIAEDREKVQKLKELEEE